MTEAEIFDGFIMRGTADFLSVVETLRGHRAAWCVIGGMGVNAYVTPLYSVECDLVVMDAHLPAVLEDLRAAEFRIRELPYSIIAQRRAGPTQRSDNILTMQFWKPAEMQPFLDRAVLRPILGLDVPVAALPDLVAAKIAAWSEPRRRLTKRLKDEIDLLRLAEAYPDIVDPLLPEALLRKAEASRQQIADYPEGDGWGGEDT